MTTPSCLTAKSAPSSRTSNARPASRNPLAEEFGETARFLSLCRELGVRLISISAGSPYYNPHVQRPAASPKREPWESELLRDCAGRLGVEAIARDA
jgi:hypothetical protein